MKDKINVKKLNETINLGNKLLKILYFLIIISGVYALTLILKEWKIFSFIAKLLKVIMPLFVGILIAWLFDPIVNFLTKKGVRRSIGISLVYTMSLIIVFLIINSIIPILIEQTNDLIISIPNVLNTTKGVVDSFFDNFKDLSFNLINIKNNIYSNLEGMADDVVVRLPAMIIQFFKFVLSGIWTIIFGLVIGFYLLIRDKKQKSNFKKYLPLTWRKDIDELGKQVNHSLRRFIQGTAFIAVLMFTACSIGFYLAGLKAPLLFGLFCGLTNIIPYVGPFIGGIPTTLVGLSISFKTGLITLIVVIIVQFVESWILQPIVMGERVNLKPITIIVGLLIFGHFFGILGMLIATPIISIIKLLINHYQDRVLEKIKTK